jgi:TRAP-type C4-dicarboxylate transport system permease large subunit
MITSLGIGFITPPLGLNLFVVSGVTGTSVMEISRYVVPFVAMMLVVVFMIAFIPTLSLWLL